jgi:hypothetical protein
VRGRPDSDPQSAAPPAGEAPENLRNLSIADRWAPLVHDPDRRAPAPAKYGQRVLAAAVCLIVLALLLWAAA